MNFIHRTNRLMWDVFNAIAEPPRRGTSALAPAAASGVGNAASLATRLATSGREQTTARRRLNGMTPLASAR